MGEVRLTKLAECAGCGAKVGAGELKKILQDIPVRYDPDLLVGYDSSDDASVYRINETTAIVQTVDFFPPIADDPVMFGRIAAANALSDIYAMGGEPKTALNIMAVPEDMDRGTVQAILRGGYEKVYEAGAVITGGHSIYDREPKYGLCVTGFVHPDRILTNAGARPGDVLIYTKTPGVGVLTAAAKADMLGAEETDRLYAMLACLNKAARDIMLRYEVHACTDITGFGMLGHLLEMADGSDTEIHVETAGIRFLDSAEEMARLGLLPQGMYRNRRYAEAYVEHGSTSLYIQDLLYDPQTSGGLMIAAAPDDAAPLFAALQADPGVPDVQRIGTVAAYAGGRRIYLD